MAEIQLKRKGYRVFYESKKLVVNFQSPEGECIYDNCGQVIGRRLRFSWDIQGRTECFGIMKTIQRLSASVINYNGNTDTSQFSVDAIGPLPTVQNPSKSTTYFGGLPQNGILTQTVTAPDTLADECGQTHGGDTDEQYTRFQYIDCVYGPAFQYTVKHAADSSLSAANLSANINALGGNYVAAIAETVACNGISAQIDTIWAALAQNPVTLALGAYE